MPPPPVLSVLIRRKFWLYIYIFFNCYILATKSFLRGSDDRVCEIKMIGEIRQNFTEASASVGLILATALDIEPSSLDNSTHSKEQQLLFFQKAFFYVVFNLIFTRFYEVFNDLSSLGNFYNFSVNIIVFTLYDRFMHFVYFMQSW